MNSLVSVVGCFENFNARVLDVYTVEIFFLRCPSLQDVQDTIKASQGSTTILAVEGSDVFPQKPHPKP